MAHVSTRVKMKDKSMMTLPMEIIPPECVRAFNELMPKQQRSFIQMLKKAGNI